MRLSTNKRESSGRGTRLLVITLSLVLSLVFANMGSAQNGAPDLTDRNWTDLEGVEIRGDFVSVDGTRVNIRRSDTGELVSLRCEHLVDADLSLICRYLDAINGQPAMPSATFRIWRLATDGRKFIGRLRTIDAGEAMIDQGATDDLGIKYAVLTEVDQNHIRERLIESGRFSLDRLEAPSEGEDPNATDENQEAESFDDDSYGSESTSLEEQNKEISDALDDANSAPPNVDSVVFVGIIVFSASVLLLLALIALRHIVFSFEKED